ncbi:PPC domain-containing DNA-binding protein [[Eubacterium] cellulosolvens]
MEYSEGRMGRIFILRLHDGDQLPEVIESFAEEKKITHGLCFILGGIKDGGKVVVGPSNETFPPNPMVRFLNGVHEICGIGILAINERGKPILHMHASFGRGGQALAGCIRLGVDIWQTGEVAIIEIAEVTALRKKDRKTGFNLLKIT